LVKIETAAPELVDSDPFYGNPALVREARVWAVDPQRGDIYALNLSGTTNNQFVRLLEGGIVERPADIKNTTMEVLCDLDGNVIALPNEDVEPGEPYPNWSPCVPMGSHLTAENYRDHLLIF
jgi:hypothetical protein